MKVVLAKTDAALEQLRVEVSVLRIVRDMNIRGCLRLLDCHEEPSEDGTLVFITMPCALDPGTHCWNHRR